MSNECTLDIFNSAVLKVRTSLVGLVEKFDESTIRFEESLQKRSIELDLSDIKQNLSSERFKPNRNEISYMAEELADLFKEVLSNNSYDLALYCAVNQLFEKEVIHGYSDKLADLKRRCAAF